MHVKPGTYFAYACGPIDWFDGWMTAAEAAAVRAREIAGVSDDAEGTVNEAASTSTDIQDAIRRAGAFLRKHGWEGDIRRPHPGSWLVGVLPDPDSFDSVVMLLVKQDNNGTTFVVSPHELPWLKPRWPLPWNIRVVGQGDTQVATQAAGHQSTPSFRQGL